MKNTVLKNKGILRRFLVIGLLIYVVCIFINQQRTLNSYKNGIVYNAQKLKEEEEHNQDLLAKKENINSQEYIEQVARGNLDMYLPNEKVYIDRSK